MPLYDYECEVCGEVFEQQRTLAQESTDPYPPCPRCGDKGKIKRIIVRACPFHLKGHGWARNAYDK